MEIKCTRCVSTRDDGNKNDNAIFRGYAYAQDEKSLGRDALHLKPLPLYHKVKQSRR